MVKIFVKYKNEIERYCVENGLSSKEVFRSARSYNDESVILQHVDHEKGKLGLLDETPADITLAIFLENGKLRFEQTEHTRKYLGITKEKPVAIPKVAVA
jgi:hypothetical protein